MWGKKDKVRQKQQLTRSLDYTWNEKGMVKKIRRGRLAKKIKRKNELVLIQDGSKTTFMAFAKCSHKTKNEGKKHEIIVGDDCHGNTGCGVEGR